MCYRKLLDSIIIVMMMQKKHEENRKKPTQSILKIKKKCKIEPENNKRILHTTAPRGICRGYL